MTAVSPPTRPWPLARRARELQPFRTMVILARAKQLIAEGRDVIRLDVGEPDFPTPQPVLDAAAALLAGGRIAYTQPSGLPALKQAIAGFYARRYGTAVDPMDVIVTTGSSAALLMIMAVLVDRDQELLGVAPGYPSHHAFAQAGEGSLRLLAGDPWPDADAVARAWTDATVGMLAASPSNPGGAVMSAARQAALIGAVEARGGVFISDELYHGLSYGLPDTTALSVSPDVFVVNSFSKYFAMTGWRLGWAVVPPRYRAAMEVMAQHLFLAPPHLSQAAALACFDPATLAICDARRDEFRRRRDFLVPALRRLGFGLQTEPEGGFYIFADAARFTDDCEAFCGRLIEEAGVSVAPGTDFGPYPTHVRFAFTTSLDRLREAVDRIARVIN